MLISEWGAGCREVKRERAIKYLIVKLKIF